MEDVAPPLKCVLYMRWKLESGSPFRESLQQYCAQNTKGRAEEFVNAVKKLLIGFQQESGLAKLIDVKLGVYRKAVLTLFYCALKGQPILQQLIELESELILSSELEIQNHVSQLPFRMMMPLLLFQFPAFLLLLLGPLILHFMASFR